MRLKVMTANVYRKNDTLGKTLKAIRNHRPERIDVCGVQEGQNIAPGSVRGYDLLIADAGDFNAKEIPVLLRGGRRRSLDGVSTFQASEDTGRPVGHDRYITVVRFRKKGKRIALINTHMNARIQRPDGSVKDEWSVTGEYRDHMQRLCERVEFERAAGYSPVVTGDFNYRPRGDLKDAQRVSLWYWSPQRALHRAGLTYLYTGLDGIAYDPAHWEAIESRPVNLPGSDHNGYFVNLEEVK